jgi:hypothetical protein
VHDHAGRLVDDGDVLVLEYDVERDRLRGNVGDVGLRDLELDDVASGYPVSGISRLAVDLNQVALDQACGRGPAEVFGVLGEKAIQPRGRGGRDQAGGLRNR